MKKAIIFICISIFASGIIFSQTSTDIENVPGLKETWTNFIQAVKKVDKKQLKYLCADSVKFSMYMGNNEFLCSQSVELSESDYEEKRNIYTNFFYVPFESFVNEELQFVFDKNLINRMDDLSKLRIIKSDDLDSEYKFYITISDPDEDFAGAEMALRFKKDKGAFLFCGIETIQ